MEGTQDQVDELLQEIQALAKKGKSRQEVIDSLSNCIADYNISQSDFEKMVDDVLKKINVIEDKQLKQIQKKQLIDSIKKDEDFDSYQSFLNDRDLPITLLEGPALEAFTLQHLWHDLSLQLTEQEILAVRQPVSQDKLKKQIEFCQDLQQILRLYSGVQIDRYAQCAELEKDVNTINIVLQGCQKKYWINQKLLFLALLQATPRHLHPKIIKQASLMHPVPLLFKNGQGQYEMPDGLFWVVQDTKLILNTAFGNARSFKLGKTQFLNKFFYAHFEENKRKACRWDPLQRTTVEYFCNQKLQKNDSNLSQQDFERQAKWTLLDVNGQVAEQHRNIFINNLNSTIIFVNLYANDVVGNKAVLEECRNTLNQNRSKIIFVVHYADQLSINMENQIRNNINTIFKENSAILIVNMQKVADPQEITLDENVQKILFEFMEPEINADPQQEQSKLIYQTRRDFNEKILKEYKSSQNQSNKNLCEKSFNNENVVNERYLDQLDILYTKILPQPSLYSVDAHFPLQVTQQHIQKLIFIQNNMNWEEAHQQQYLALIVNKIQQLEEKYQEDVKQHNKSYFVEIFFDIIHVIEEKYKIQTDQKVRDWYVLYAILDFQQELVKLDASISTAASKSRQSSQQHQHEVNYEIIYDAENNRLSLTHVFREVKICIKEKMFLHDLRKPVDIWNKFFKIFIQSGEPFEFFNGDILQLTLQNEIDMICRDIFPKQEIKCVSAVGHQKAGKSTLLNNLFRRNFLTAALRCTKGLYASFIQIQNNTPNQQQQQQQQQQQLASSTSNNNYSLVLVIDSEGVDSGEREKILSQDYIKFYLEKQDIKLEKLQESDYPLKFEYEKFIISMCFAISDVAIIVNNGVQPGQWLKNLQNIVDAVCQEIRKGRQYETVINFFFNMVSGTTTEEELTEKVIQSYVNLKETDSIISKKNVKQVPQAYQIKDIYKRTIFQILHCKPELMTDNYISTMVSLYEKIFTQLYPKLSSQSDGQLVYRKQINKWFSDSFQDIQDLLMNKRLFDKKNAYQVNTRQKLNKIKQEILDELRPKYITLKSQFENWLKVQYNNLNEKVANQNDQRTEQLNNGFGQKKFTSKIEEYSKETFKQFRDKWEQKTRVFTDQQGQIDVECQRMIDLQRIQAEEYIQNQKKKYIGSMESYLKDLRREYYFKNSLKTMEKEILDFIIVKMKVGDIEKVRQQITGFCIEKFKNYERYYEETNVQSYTDYYTSILNQLKVLLDEEFNPNEQEIQMERELKVNIQDIYIKLAKQSKECDSQANIELQQLTDNAIQLAFQWLDSNITISQDYHRDKVLKVHRMDIVRNLLQIKDFQAVFELKIDQKVCKNNSNNQIQVNQQDIYIRALSIKVLGQQVFNEQSIKDNYILNRLICPKQIDDLTIHNNDIYKQLKEAKIPDQLRDNILKKCKEYKDQLFQELDRHLNDKTNTNIFDDINLTQIKQLFTDIGDDVLQYARELNQLGIYVDNQSLTKNLYTAVLSYVAILGVLQKSVYVSNRLFLQRQKIQDLLENQLQFAVAYLDFKEKADDPENDVRLVQRLTSSYKTKIIEQLNNRIIDFIDNIIKKQINIDEINLEQYIQHTLQEQLQQQQQQRKQQLTQQHIYQILTNDPQVRQDWLRQKFEEKVNINHLMAQEVDYWKKNLTKIINAIKTIIAKHSKDEISDEDFNVTKCFKPVIIPNQNQDRKQEKIMALSGMLYIKTYLSGDLTTDSKFSDSIQLTNQSDKSAIPTLNNQKKLEDSVIDQIFGTRNEVIMNLYKFISNLVQELENWQNQWIQNYVCDSVQSIYQTECNQLITLQMQNICQVRCFLCKKYCEINHQLEPKAQHECKTGHLFAGFSGVHFYSEVQAEELIIPFTCEDFEDDRFGERRLSFAPHNITWVDLRESECKNKWNFAMQKNFKELQKLQLDLWGLNLTDMIDKEWLNVALKDRTQRLQSIIYSQQLKAKFKNTIAKIQNSFSDRVSVVFKLQEINQDRTNKLKNQFDISKGQFWCLDNKYKRFLAFMNTIAYNFGFISQALGYLDDFGETDLGQFLQGLIIHTDTNQKYEKSVDQIWQIVKKQLADFLSEYLKQAQNFQEQQSYNQQEYDGLQLKIFQVWRQMVVKLKQYLSTKIDSRQEMRDDGDIQKLINLQILLPKISDGLKLKFNAIFKVVTIFTDLKRLGIQQQQQQASELTFFPKDVQDAANGLNIVKIVPFIGYSGRNIQQGDTQEQQFHKRDMRGVLAFDINGKIKQICWRGSCQNYDWKTNFQQQLVQFNKIFGNDKNPLLKEVPGKVNYGFANVVSQSLATKQPHLFGGQLVLQQCLEDYSEGEILYTGHSLGAALGLISSAIHRINKESQVRVKGWFFSQPRSCDEELACFIDRKFKVDRCLVENPQEIAQSIELCDLFRQNVFGDPVVQSLYDHSSFFNQFRSTLQIISVIIQKIFNKEMLEGLKNIIVDLGKQQIAEMGFFKKLFVKGLTNFQEKWNNFFRQLPQQGLQQFIQNLGLPKGDLSKHARINVFVVLKRDLIKNDLYPRLVELCIQKFDEIIAINSSFAQYLPKKISNKYDKQEVISFVRGMFQFIGSLTVDKIQDLLFYDVDLQDKGQSQHQAKTKQQQIQEYIKFKIPKLIRSILIDTLKKEKFFANIMTYGDVLEGILYFASGYKDTGILLQDYLDDHGQEKRIKEKDEQFGKFINIIVKKIKELIKLPSDNSIECKQQNKQKFEELLRELYNRVIDYIAPYHYGRGLLSGCFSPNLVIDTDTSKMLSEGYYSMQMTRTIHQIKLFQTGLLHQSNYNKSDPVQNNNTSNPIQNNNTSDPVQNNDSIDISSGFSRVYTKEEIIQVLKKRLYLRYHKLYKKEPPQSLKENIVKIIEPTGRSKQLDQNNAEKTIKITDPAKQLDQLVKFFFLLNFSMQIKNHNNVGQHSIADALTAKLDPNIRVKVKTIIEDMENEQNEAIASFDYFVPILKQLEIDIESQQLNNAFR